MRVHLRGKLEAASISRPKYDSETEKDVLVTAAATMKDAVRKVKLIHLDRRFTDFNLCWLQKRNFPRFGCNYRLLDGNRMVVCVFADKLYKLNEIHRHHWNAKRS